jgi:hypothetical protein
MLRFSIQHYFCSFSSKVLLISLCVFSVDASIFDSTFTVALSHLKVLLISLCLLYGVVLLKEFQGSGPTLGGGGGMWSSSSNRQINYGFAPEMGMVGLRDVFGVAPASFHHGNQHQETTINFDPQICRQSYSKTHLIC